MPTFVDADVFRSASLENMVSHLSGPLSAGAVDTEVEVGPTAEVVITRVLRDPLLLAAPRTALGARGLRLGARLGSGGGAVQLPSLEFAPYTERGAFLVLLRPTVGTTRTAAPFRLALTLREVVEDGTETLLEAADVAGRIEVKVVEGLFGQVLYLLGVEKQRIRRQARILAAMRLIGSARDNALDRIGADLSVPRFADELVYETNTANPSKSGIATRTAREEDPPYRERLRLFRPFRLLNRRQVLESLNGPGDTGPNSGPLGRMGLTARFQVRETNNPFAVAVHIVGIGNPQFRQNFLDHVRVAHLVWPKDSTEANAIYAARFLGTETRQRENDLRASLRSSFAFAATAAIAPMLATILDRVGRCRKALGATGAWQVLRAQDSTAGSRYELGLGVDLAPLPAADLDGLYQRITSTVRVPSTDPEIEALLQSILRSNAARQAADDPDGRWLLTACGLRTVHRVNAATLYVSHFPTDGLTIDGGDNIAGPPATLPLSAIYHAPGDAGRHAVLTAGLATAATQWAAAGHDPWTELSDADAKIRWHQAGPRPATDPALGVFAAAGLPAIALPGPIAQQLDRVATELMVTIRLPLALTQRIAADQPTAITELRDFVRILRAQGLSSAVPLLVSPGEIVVVVGVVGLPGAGLNLSDVRSSGFRWYVVPIQNGRAAVRTIGSRTTVTGEKPGVVAVIVVGYARRPGAVDPFEYRVDLPDGAVLSLLEYEFLMNILERSFPMGVVVNTFSIRREHVDVIGDGSVERLQPTAARTYRRFHRERHRGETSVTLEAP